MTLLQTADIILSPTLIIILIVLIIMTILISIYVYHDASKRNMNAELWIIIILLSGAIIGLIIYIFARRKHKYRYHPKKKIK